MPPIDHPDNDEAADERRAVRRDGEQGEHRAPERAEYRNGEQRQRACHWLPAPPRRRPRPTGPAHGARPRPMVDTVKGPPGGTAPGPAGKTGGPGGPGWPDAAGRAGRAGGVARLRAFVRRHQLAPYLILCPRGRHRRRPLWPPSRSGSSRFRTMACRRSPGRRPPSGWAWATTRGRSPTRSSGCRCGSPFFRGRRGAA